MRISIILSTLIFLCTSCIECMEGDVEACDCGINSYINTCAPDGYFPYCECYDNGDYYYDYYYDDKEYYWDEELIDFYPWCADTYTDDCGYGEVKIPCTNLCWRKCPIGMYWENNSCHGNRDILHYEGILNKCKEENNSYRLPSLDEVSFLLNQCYIETFNTSNTNYCSSFQLSPMSLVLSPPDKSFITSWIGELSWCKNQYGLTTKSCAWNTLFYVDIILDTEFNWLYANGTAGSALAGGICVREQ